MKFASVTLMIAVIMTMGLLAVHAPAAEKEKYESLKDKRSYTIGYQLGAEMREHQVFINPEALAAGARAAVQNNKPAMTLQEMSMVLKALQKEIKEKVGGIKEKPGTRP